jgi:hypothetical protein
VLQIALLCVRQQAAGPVMSLLVECSTWKHDSMNDECGTCCLPLPNTCQGGTHAGEAPSQMGGTVKVSTGNSGFA